MNTYFITFLLPSIFFYQSTNGQNGTIAGTHINCESDHATDPEKHDCGSNYIITGINTEHIQCKYNQCTGTTFNITTPAPTFDFDSERSGFENGILIASNVKEIDCNGLQSCQMSTFDLVCLIEDGCDFDCDGLKSCYDVKVNMTNGKKVTCTGEDTYEGGDTSLACFSGEFVINGTIDGLFEVDCEKKSSCEQTTWNINLGNLPSGKEYHLIKYEFEGVSSGKDITIEINALPGTTPSTIVVELECDESDGLKSCDNIGVVAGTGITLECIAYCEPTACGTINGCSIQETFLKVNQPKFFTNESRIVIVFTSISIFLLIIFILVCCYLKSKKMKTKVTFEKHDDIDEIHDDINDINDDNEQNMTKLDTIEAQQITTGN